MQANPSNSIAPADQELEQRILASLQALHVPSLRGVSVQAQAGHVVLRGEVTSFYAKQLSQHSARRLAGDSRVVDEVRVVTPATLRDRSRLASLAAAGALLFFISLRFGDATGEPGSSAVEPSRQSRPIALFV